MIKNVIYKEPERYFTKEMLETAEKWEKQHQNDASNPAIDSDCGELSDTKTTERKNNEKRI